MHIDPFAPGGSPQHPANFGKDLQAAHSEQFAEDPDATRYAALLEEFGTAEEQAAALAVDGDPDDLPSFDELEARAEDGSVYVLRLNLFGTEDEKTRDDWTFWQLHERFDFGTAPAASAPKAEWVAYAERVATVRGEEIPRDEAGEPGTIAQLKEYASHAFELGDEETE